MGTALVGVAIALVPDDARAGHTLYLEAVDDYTTGCSQYGYNDTYESIAEVNSFRDELLTSGNGLDYHNPEGSAYYDTDVFTSDFYDPEKNWIERR